MPSQNTTSEAARSRLIVALDLPSRDAAWDMAEKLSGHAGMFKAGLELFAAEGPALARHLAARNEGLFLDLKLHDIPNTVQAAALQIAQLGVRMFTVHATGGRKMMEAARAGAAAGAPGQPRPLVLAVTVLTSLGRSDLEQVGIAGSPEDVAVRLARLAQSAGLDGVVASAREAVPIRRACGSEFVIVTPGIRPGSVPAQDQARVSTPGDAIRSGADYLVVGRPITWAPDPAAAARAIATEIEQALTPHQPETVQHG